MIMAIQHLVHLVPWPGLGTGVWSFYGFETLQGIAEDPIVFWRMEDASVLYFNACMSG